MKRCQKSKCQILKLCATNNVYIYGLIDPRTNGIRYVGKSVNPKRRFKRHLVEARSGLRGYKNNWIRNILRSGAKPVLEILVVASDANWEQEERGVITQLKANGEKLTNTETGGRGGHSVAISTRHKMSLAQRRRYAKLRSIWGVAATPETRHKLSQNAAGHCWNTGWHHTAATRRRLSWLKLRKREQISARMRGKSYITPGGRVRLSKARKKSSKLYTLSNAEWRYETNGQIAKRLGMTSAAVNCYRWRNNKPKNKR